MNRYEKGFITKCAEYGVDGRKLLEKMAQATNFTNNANYDRYTRNPLSDYVNKLKLDRAKAVNDAAETPIYPYSVSKPMKYNWYNTARAPWTLQERAKDFPGAPKLSVSEWGDMLRNMRDISRGIRYKK